MGKLILSRRPQERIFMQLPDGQTIVVSVAEIRGAKVRLSFEAPADVVIIREELLGKDKRESA